MEDTFGQQVINYTKAFRPDWQLPEDIELLFPYGKKATMQAVSQFYTKFFNDRKERTFLFGINPGRFGSGITGVSFTDPYFLETTCGIPNDFDKKKELSSIFINEVIMAFGGAKAFYEKFYITAVSHLGFIKEGKNINYYDDKALQKAVLPHIIRNIQTQIQFGANRKVAFSIGKGTNYKFLTQLNKEHRFFDKIEALPHPRWVLQYRRKTKELYVDEYLNKLGTGSWKG
ncbi:MAG TPA: DUF4918 family protein [Saprospiraceae bacterium]|nr:DUF4918 family protein [Saprospiraceae bacterium]